MQLSSVGQVDEDLLFRQIARKRKVYMSFRILLTVMGFIPETTRDYVITGFFEISATAAVIFFHYLGTRLFTRALEAGKKASIIFGLVILLLGLAGSVLSTIIPDLEIALIIGLVAGGAIWTSLGEVTEQLGWTSPLERPAILLFLASLMIWLTTFLLQFPIGLIAAAGYPVCVWGLHLIRTRILAKWGAQSFAGTILILVNSVVAGCGLALGLVGKTFVSGVIGGVVFAMVFWSALEVIWERGMTRRPWKIDD